MVEETGETSCGRTRPSSTNWLPHAAAETDGLNQGKDRRIRLGTRYCI